MKIKAIGARGEWRWRKEKWGQSLEHSGRSAGGEGARKGAEKKLPGKWCKSEEYDISADHLSKNCFLLIWGWENGGNESLAGVLRLEGGVRTKK